MNRCLIFFSSLLITFVTISSASSANPWDWSRATAAPSSASRGIQARFGSSWSPLAPSDLIATDVIRL